MFCASEYYSSVKSTRYQGQTKFQTSVTDYKSHKKKKKLYTLT